MASHRNQLQLIIYVLIFLHIVAPNPTVSLLSSDANALLKFKETLHDETGALSSWSSSTSPCFGNKNNWAGLICSRAGNIWGLRLENMKLSGSIDVDSLAQLPRLRSISFMNNNFGGNLPDLKKLKPLKSIFVSYNHFDGSIAPDAFEGLRRLTKIHLENNNFSGKIPTSLTKLAKLVELNLENNHFEGDIPDLKLSTFLQGFNVSNNQLQGSIPSSLAKFDSSSFAGNKELCGAPMQVCSSTPTNQASIAPPQTPPTSPDKPIPIIAIIIGVIIAMALAILVILMVLHSKSDKTKTIGSSTTSNPPRKTVVGDGDEGSRTGGGGGGRNKGENGKLTFIRDDREKFDLPDLLKAAAEILGSGCFGSSYKATLNSGNTVVVKRFRLMNNVGREEFQEQLRRLGRISHPNLLPLVAYYYRKEEKLFITDPIQKGSLAMLLHGQTRGKPTLDWPTRLKVIKGVAKGVSHLYKELPSLVAPHGHLKSSNILLTNSYEPVISDYGLIPLINQESVQEMMVAYKSPEYYNNGRITKKTDVWALGILIIETLTGKFPAPYLQQGSEVDMTTWVKSTIDEGFDKNMGQTRNSDGEIQKLLSIGIACCDSSVEKRLDINEAYERIEDVRERDNDDDFYSTYASTEADVRSSRGMSDDFTVIIN